MHKLVTVLPQADCSRVEAIWRLLEAHSPAVQLRLPRFPYFSWLEGEDLPEGKSAADLREISSAWETFPVFATGLGIFPGDAPVLYIPIVKTAQLYHLQQQIWEHFHKAGWKLSPGCAPENWVPHIPLAEQPLTRETLGKTLQKLAFKELHLEMKADNLSLISVPDGKSAEMLSSSPLTGKPTSTSL